MAEINLQIIIKKDFVNYFLYRFETAVSERRHSLVLTAVKHDFGLVGFFDHFSSFAILPVKGITLPAVKLVLFAGKIRRLLAEILGEFPLDDEIPFIKHFGAGFRSAFCHLMFVLTMSTKSITV
jgi:hypothetical protein